MAPPLAGTWPTDSEACLARSGAATICASVTPGKGLVEDGDGAPRVRCGVRLAFPIWDFVRLDGVPEFGEPKRRRSWCRHFSRCSLPNSRARRGDDCSIAVGRIAAGQCCFDGVASGSN